MSFARGLVSQGEVVYALVLRETRTRFGQHKLGYVWALLEPVLMILTFWVLFSIAHRAAPYGMDLFSFIGTGIVPYLLFSNCVSRVADAISGNKAMLFYPHVMPLDLVIARCVLESVTYSLVFIVLMGVRALYLQELVVDDPLLVLIGFALATLFGTTLGLVFCALAQFSNVVDRARSPLLRPFFWLSGIFFTANSLPGGARELMLWNPVLHATEFVRDGWFPSYTAHYAQVAYPMAWILGLGVVGLSLERVVRRRIELT